MQQKQTVPRYVSRSKLLYNRVITSSVQTLPSFQHLISALEIFEAPHGLETFTPSPTKFDKMHRLISLSRELGCLVYTDSRKSSEICREIQRGLEELIRMESCSPSAPQSESPPAQKSKKKEKTKTYTTSGRHTCTQCGSTSTPEWRKSPFEAETLCNACGLFHSKLVKKKGSQEAARILLERRKTGGWDRRIPN